MLTHTTPRSLLMQAAVLSAIGIASPALADGEATWLWEVTTQDGDAIVEPGETATVTLRILMEPLPGFGPDAIISAVQFDTLNAGGADLGAILGWDVNDGLVALTGDTTTTDGVNLFNTQAGQLSVQRMDLNNPVIIITFEWRPNDYHQFDAHYVTIADFDFGDPHEVTVWEYDTWRESAVIAIYPIIEADITITVACPDDFNGDGVHNILDFVAFQQAFVGQDPVADCNADESLDVLDFVCFQQLFVNGCP